MCYRTLSERDKKTFVTILYKIPPNLVEKWKTLEKNKKKPIVKKKDNYSLLISYILLLKYMLIYGYHIIKWWNHGY